MSCSKRYSLHKVNNVTDHEYTIFKPIIVAIKFPRNCKNKGILRFVAVRYAAGARTW